MTLRSEAEIAALVTDPPISPPPLPARPCAVCGVAVPAVEDDDVPIEYHDTTIYSPSGTVVGGRQTWVELGLCPRCRAAETLVVSLVEVHPGLSARLGPAGAERVASGVVTALDLLGRALPAPDLADRDFGVLVRHLGAVGGLAAYRLQAGTLPGGAAHRWAHVGGELRTRVRAAYGGVLVERIAASRPPVAVPPPGPGERGCLFCGVDAVAVPAVALARGGTVSPWTPRRVSAVTLGASQRDSGRTVVGHLCPPCDAAAVEEGAIGPSALVRALAGHLRATGETDAARRLEQADAERTLTGVLGWGALPAGTKPNAAAWGHLDLPE